MLPIAIVGGTMLVLFIASAIFLRRVLVIAGPNEAVVLAGQRRLRFVRGGRVVRMPLVEKAARLDLSNINIEIELEGAYTRKLIGVNISGVANLKLDGMQPGVERAAMRLMGLSRDDIANRLTRIIQATARGVVAARTAQELEGDPEAFAARIIQEAELRLRSLGVTVDTLKIQKVSSDAGYSDSVSSGQPSAAAAPSAPAPTPVTASVEPTPIGAPAFLPAAQIAFGFKAEAKDPKSGERVSIELGSFELIMRPSSALLIGEALATIQLTSDFTVGLMCWPDGAGALLHIEVRQERLGTTTRIGLSSTTETFTAPVTGPVEAERSFPRLEEAAMQTLLAGLRSAMHLHGGETWSDG